MLSSHWASLAAGSDRMRSQHAGRPYWVSTVRADVVTRQPALAYRFLEGERRAFGISVDFMPVALRVCIRPSNKLICI